MVALAAAAFAVGAVIGAQSGASPADSLAGQFVAAWTKGDYVAMYTALDAPSRRAVSAARFASAYREALITATATGMHVTGAPRGESGGRVVVPVVVSTRLFGELALDFTMRVTEAGGEGAGISWSPSLAFPGVQPGETLSRHTVLPQRATLLARDGSVLAEGPSGSAVATQAGETTRSSPLGEDARALLGEVGPIPSSRRGELEAEGVPADALVGLSGLERALDEELRGTPGGELLAGARVLASVQPHQASAVRTSISPALQRAAVTALGGQLGGVVALEPSSGRILAVGGIGLDGLQPPGSTFKIVTLTGVLQAGVASPHTVFPYATYATLDGVKLHNAGGEECGGTLEHAFAVSCNSVFTPLGVRLGSARLVHAAESFGFNEQPGLAGVPESTLPTAASIQGELELGSTAIGQGQVLATPLQMAIVAATIADAGRRPAPTFLLGARPSFVARASSAAVARTVRRLMIGVVRSGTGTAAAIAGVTVAGKTGTAELKSPCTPAAGEPGSSEPASAEAPKEAGRERCSGTETEASNTDAWFVAYAPALHPRIAVCVLLVKDGAGGTTAAPVARQVLEAGLQAGL
jgi:peptidoglycan glycosyltransferase